MNENNAIKNLILKVLFIIGIIVLIFIFAYAVVKIVPKIYSGLITAGEWVISPFQNKGITITSTKTDLNSGDEFTLNWTHKNNGEGFYAVSYDCEENLSVQVISSSTPIILLCDRAFKLGDAKTVTLSVTLDKINLFKDLSVRIDYISLADGMITTTSKIDLTVKRETAGAKNATSTSIVSEPVKTDTNYGSAGTKNTANTAVYSSPADLAISNAYAITGNTITFTISNIGGQSTGSWSFDYSDPFGITRTSPVQMSLSSGQALKFTLAFDPSTPAGSVIINANPRGTVYEISKTNNVAAVNIGGGYSLPTSVLPGQIVPAAPIVLDNSFGGGFYNNYDFYDNGDDDYNRNDKADLKVVTFEVGRISGGRFVEDNKINEDDTFATRLVIKNIGGDPTDDFRFEISNLPYDNSNDDDYKSIRVNALYPGQSREIIVGFDRPDTGSYSVKVKVDSDNDVREESESNNTKTASLQVSR